MATKRKGKQTWNPPAGSSPGCLLGQTRAEPITEQLASGGRLRRPSGWGRWWLQPARRWPALWRTGGTGSDSTTAPTAWGPAGGPWGCPRSEPPAPGRRAAPPPPPPGWRAERCGSAGRSYGPGSERPESERRPAAADPDRSDGPAAPDPQSRSCRGQRSKVSINTEAHCSHKWKVIIIIMSCWVVIMRY